MTHLPLTFGRGSLITIGCANGVPLRYEIRHVGCGAWELEIEARGKLYNLGRHRSERDAKACARADFRRRQIVRLAA